MKRIFLSCLTLVGLIFFQSCDNTPTGADADDTETVEEVQEAQGPDIVGEEVTYSTDSTEMKGYIAYDANAEGKRPGILIVHEWWGHNDHVRDRAKMLAEMGYVAMALDMYGDGKKAEHPSDAGKFSSEVFANLDEAKARFEKAMETLKGNSSVDTDKIGAIGYCFGGSVVLSMANAGYDLDGVVAFHSGVQLPIAPDAEKMKAKVLVCNGADDPFISPESITAYKASMDAIGADYQYLSYPGAVHAFTNAGATELGEKFELPLAYNEEVDQASWEEMKKLFNQVFTD